MSAPDANSRLVLIGRFAVAGSILVGSLVVGGAIF